MFVAEFTEAFETKGVLGDLTGKKKGESKLKRRL